MSLTYGSLQALPWKNDTIIEKMDGRKWCRHIRDFFQYMHAWIQGSVIICIYISLQQFLFCKNSKFDWMSGGNCSFLIEKKGNSLNGWLQLDLRINSIPLKIGIAASACLKKTEYPWQDKITASGLLKQW